MNIFLRTVFRQINNQVYTGKKLALIQASIGLIPLLIITGIGAVLYDERLWFVFVGIIIFSLFSFFVIDAIHDKLTWRLFWSRWYADETKPWSKDELAMRTYEKKPTPENLNVLKNDLGKK